MCPSVLAPSSPKAAASGAPPQPTQSMTSSDRPRHQAIRSRISGVSGGAALADRVGGAHPRLGAAQRRLVGRVDTGERRVRLDRGAEPDQVLEARRAWSIGVARPGAARRRARRRRARAPGRRSPATKPARPAATSAISGAPAQMRLERVEEVGRPAERRDHALEALGGRARGEAPRAGGRRPPPASAASPREREQLAPERDGHVPEPAVDDVAAQEARGRRHLERIAGGRWRAARSCR